MLFVQTQDLFTHTSRRISEFFTRAARSSSRALLLDYDGTLAKFSTDPQTAFPYSGIPPLLERIRKFTGTRVVLVSGRRVQDVARLLGLEKLEAWGCHGLEYLHPDGLRKMSEPDPAILRAMQEVDRLLAREGISDLVENKPAGRAVHWRGMPEQAAKLVKIKVKGVWSMLPDRLGLCLLEFDGGMEIRSAAKNKGDVVRTILNSMSKDSAVAYLGDDQTDEDAFAALQGYGLSVLVRPTYRPTVADAWIRPPEGVISFLTEWAETCKANGDRKTI